MIMIDVACTAACLLAVIAIGAYMPILAGMSSETGGNQSTVTASIIGEHIWTGHIMIAILGFLAGMCLTVLLYRIHRRSENMEQEEKKTMDRD